MAARKTRVEAVLATAEPWETEAELAARAGVHRATINRYKSCERTDCNKEHDPDCSDNPAVQIFCRALYKLSMEERVYVSKHVLPKFKPSQRLEGFRPNK